MRKKTIEPDKILLATIHLVAENGLENLSTRKVSSESGVSDGCLFNYFNNKTDLLIKCLYFIDKEIDTALKTVPINIFTPKKTIKKLWLTYFDYLIKNPDYTKYYIQFRHSSYYTKEVIEGQNKSFSFFAKLLNSHRSIFKIDTDVFWVYVIETTLNFASRIADGLLPYKDGDEEMYFLLMSHGMSGIFNNVTNWEPEDDE